MNETQEFPVIQSRKSWLAYAIHLVKYTIIMSIGYRLYLGLSEAFTKEGIEIAPYHTASNTCSHSSTLLSIGQCIYIVCAYTRTKRAYGFSEVFSLGVKQQAASNGMILTKQYILLALLAGLHALTEFS